MKVAKPVVIIVAGATAIGVGTTTLLASGAFFARPKLQFAGLAALVAGGAVFVLADRLGVISDESSSPRVLFDERSYDVIDDRAGHATQTPAGTNSTDALMTFVSDVKEMLSPPGGDRE